MCQKETKELILFLEEAKKIQPIWTITFKASFFWGGEKNNWIAHNYVLPLKIEFVTAERKKKGSNKQKRFVTFNWNMNTIFHKFCQNT